MKVPLVMLFALAQVAFLVGCGKSEKTDDSHPSQIVHAQRERDRQIDLEEERHRGDPDVKVDTGGL